TVARHAREIKADLCRMGGPQGGRTERSPREAQAGHKNRPLARSNASRLGPDQRRPPASPTVPSRLWISAVVVSPLDQPSGTRPRSAPKPPPREGQDRAAAPCCLEQRHHYVDAGPEQGSSRTRQHHDQKRLIDHRTHPAHSILPSPFALSAARPLLARLTP